MSFVVRGCLEIAIDQSLRPSDSAPAFGSAVYAFGVGSCGTPKGVPFRCGWTFVGKRFSSALMVRFGNAEVRRTACLRAGLCVGRWLL
jgi:hypothetical protein